MAKWRRASFRCVVRNLFHLFNTHTSCRNTTMNYSPHQRDHLQRSSHKPHCTPFFGTMRTLLHNPQLLRRHGTHLSLDDLVETCPSASSPFNLMSPTQSPCMSKQPPRKHTLLPSRSRSKQRPEQSLPPTTMFRLLSPLRNHYTQRSRIVS